LTAGFSWQDAILTSNPDGLEGNRFAGVPQQSGSLLLSHQSTNGWKSLLAVACQGDRQGDLANSFQVTGYCRYDTALHWQPSPDTELNFSIHNLSDKRYVSAVSGADFLRFGNRRQISLGFSYSY